MRIKAWIRAIESRYAGVEVIVEPWTDPDGDRRIRWWLEVLNVCDKDFFPLKDLGLRLAYDLYDDSPTFMFTVNGRKATAAYHARRRETEERERRIRRRGRGPLASMSRDRRLRPSARAGRA